MKLPAANSTTTQGDSLARWWPWLAVAVIILLVGFIRVRLLTTPLERDEGEYAYAGQLILQGIPPYELVYNMKLPGTYFAYALGMALFGGTVSGVHLTLLVVNSLTCVFVFLLGRKIAGVTVGLTACASYAALSVNTAVLGLAAHATQFVVFMAVPAALLLWNALASGSGRTYFLSGFLFGLAFLMKQPGMCFGLFALAMMTWQAVEKRSGLTPGFFRLAGIFCAGWLLPFTFLCLMVLVAGDFARFWFWTFRYASSYATGRTLSEGIDALAGMVRSQFPPYAGFWLLAALGLVAAARVREKQRELAFVLAFLGFAGIGTAAGLYFRIHYFVLVLPAFALLLGLGVESLGDWLSRRRMRWVSPVLLVMAIAWSVFQQQWVLFRLTPPQVCQAVYPGNPFAESIQIAQAIREHSAPDARVAVIGSEPQIYFYAQRHSATGYIYTYGLMEPQPYARSMQQEMIGEIEAAKPEFIVLVNCELSWLARDTSDPAIFRWGEQYTRQFYNPVSGVGRGPKTASAQDHWANEFTNLPPESMVLYQRKPDAN